MTLVQSHYRGRGDGAQLNSASFDHAVDSDWTQLTDQTFRVRFEVDETAGTAETFAGQLEANVDGGSWFEVSNASGTVTAALSGHFTDSDATTNVITGSTATFVAGTGSTAGAATAVALTSQHTEVEYSVRIVDADVSTGGTIGLRVGSMDTYAKTPSLNALKFSVVEQVRLKIGDADSVLLTDTEIQSHIAAWPGNTDLAAANAAEAIAAKFSQDYNFSTDGQVFNRRERVMHYMDLAATLRKRGGTFEWPRT